MRCVATFISNGRNSNEKRMEQLRAAVEDLKAVTDSETEDYQQRQWKASHAGGPEFARVGAVLPRTARTTAGHA